LHLRGKAERDTKTIKKNQEGKKEKLNKSYRCTFKKSAGVLVT